MLCFLHGCWPPYFFFAGKEFKLCLVLSGWERGVTASLCFLPCSQGGEAVGGSGSLEWLDLDGDVTASRLGLCPLLYKKR